MSPQGDGKKKSRETSVLITEALHSVSSSKSHPRHKTCCFQRRLSLCMSLLVHFHKEVLHSCILGTC